MQETAYAKLNLALHVRARESDGFHRIETLFAFAEDGDLLSVAEADDVTLDLDGPFAGALPGDGNNLVMKAANALYPHRCRERGAAITLTKKLPVASGIGGGSADAAAALRLLLRWWDIAIPPDAVLEMAARLGADVPACLLSRPLRGDERGDKLVGVPDAALGGRPLLLVNPGVALSTANVFRNWDGIDRGPLMEGDPIEISLSARNDLEAPASTLVPQIQCILSFLRERPGAGLVRMSGSGATCFALFDNIGDRDAAKGAIARAHPDWWCLASRLRSERSEGA